MELRKVVSGRRSIRRFIQKTVPGEIIQGLIADALWSPSWGNTQPWEIVIVTGEALERFKKKNRDAMLSHKPPKAEIPMPQTWPSSFEKRYKDLGKSVLGSLSIDRKDKKKRFEHFAHMFSLFDAPVMILITIDKKLSLEYAMLDVGIFLQTFCLLAHDRGLGTCIMAATVMYPEMAHKIFSIPETKALIIGAAIGWPALNEPVNCFKRERGSAEEFTRWIK